MKMCGKFGCKEHDDCDGPEYESCGGVPDADDRKVITMFYATDIKATCPVCDGMLTGWIGDPRGAEEETECEFCGAKLFVHPDADVEFDY